MHRALKKIGKRRQTYWVQNNVQYIFGSIFVFYWYKQCAGLASQGFPKSLFLEREAGMGGDRRPVTLSCLLRQERVSGTRTTTDAANTKDQAFRVLQ